ncbi:hypothetical protein AGLY_005763 [Aphis glycines]|uniref:Uncharacterized protein n=1 Tax=Aphis glycines TaxID=307491 RepID=A0A6G0TU80_APHGL|nr:hypothetical protein AGLY_005763 [Aphis glycines]
MGGAPFNLLNAEIKLLVGLLLCHYKHLIFAEQTNYLILDKKSIKNKILKTILQKYLHQLNKKFRKIELCKTEKLDLMEIKFVLISFDEATDENDIHIIKIAIVVVFVINRDTLKKFMNNFEFRGLSVGGHRELRHTMTDVVYVSPSWHFITTICIQYYNIVGDASKILQITSKWLIKRFDIAIKIGPRVTENVRYFLRKKKESISIVLLFENSIV